MIIPDSTEHTDVFIGTKTTSGLSIFLKDRVLVRRDSRPWPLLEGLVVYEQAKVFVDDEQRETVVPLVHVQCLLVSLSPIGRRLETKLYAKSKELDPQTAIDDKGTKTKVPFFFDFASEPLAPSLLLSPPGVNAPSSQLALGTHWFVSAYLALRAPPTSSYSEVSLSKLPISSSMPFTVTFRHSTRSTGNQVPSPTKALRSLFSLYKRFSSPLDISARFLEPPVYEPNSGSSGPLKTLKLQVNLSKLGPSQSVDCIRVTLRQTIKVFMETPLLPHNVLSKKEMELLMDRPSLRCDSGTDVNDQELSFLYALAPVWDAKQSLKKTKQESLAVVDHPGSSQSSSDALQLVPSTASHDPVQGHVSTSVQYSVLIHVFLRSVSNWGLEGTSKWTIELPLTLSYGDPKEAAVTLRSQLGSAGSVVPSRSPDAFLQSTPDEFGSLVSELLDDLFISINMLECLKESVDRPEFSREPPSRRMVTSPSDHVYVLENILGALNIQAELFRSRESQVKVPKTPVPVNLLVLELELLTESVRMGPWTVLDRVLEYLKAYKAVINSWIRGCEIGKHQETVKALAKSFETLEKGLIVFVDGVACV